MTLTEDQEKIYGGTLIRLSVVERGCGELTSLVTPTVGATTEILGDQLVLSEDFFTRDPYARADEVWTAFQAEVKRPDWAQSWRLYHVAQAIRDRIKPSYETGCGPQTNVSLKWTAVRDKYAAAGVDVTNPGSTPADLYRYLTVGSDRGLHSIAAWRELVSTKDANAFAFVKYYLNWSMRTAVSAEDEKIVTDQRQRFMQFLKELEPWTAYANVQPPMFATAR